MVEDFVVVGANRFFARTLSIKTYTITINTSSFYKNWIKKNSLSHFTLNIFLLCFY